MSEWLNRLLWLPDGASASARAVDGLHEVFFLITLVAALALFGAASVLLLRWHRRSEDEAPAPAPRAPLALEVAAVALPLAGALLFWGLGLARSAPVRGAPADALDVLVVARQWTWSFAYPGGRSTDARLYVPAGRAVRLLLTSRDVIHGFSAPAFRVQQDAVPGRVSTTWLEASAPGAWPIFCTEHCGGGHSAMRGEVVALGPADWAAWLDGRLAAPASEVDLARVGARVMVDQACARCHSSTGDRGVGPTFARFYGTPVPLEKGADVLADEGYITESMMDPTAKVVKTFTPLMPSYQGKIGAAETAAIIEYVKSMRGPAVPESVVPGGARP